MTIPPRLPLLVLLWAALAGPATAQTAQDLYRDGVAARTEGRLDEAAGLIERALALEPDNADALVQLGFIHLAEGRNDEAETLFDQVLELAPDYQDARYGLAQIAFRRGRNDRARELIGQVIEAQPDNADAAALLQRLDDAAAEAEAQAAAARAESPPDPQEARVPAPAAEDPRRAERRRLGALVDEARRLRLAGRFAESEARYREALKISPEDADILVALGLVAGHQDRIAEAEAFFERALAIAPDYVDARLGLARLALRRDDVARARTLAGQAMAEDPESVDAALVVARIATIEGRIDEAAAMYEAISRRAPENAEALVGLGDARAAQWRFGDASSAYRQALTLEPQSEEIRERLARPVPKRWRLTVGSEASMLSGGRSEWTDSAAALSYRTDRDTTLTGRTRLARRSGQTDLQLEARIDHRFRPGLDAYLLMAGTPDADFLAGFSMGGGVNWRALEDGIGGGPLFLNVDLRRDVFADSDVTTIIPGVQSYFLDERLAVWLRFIHARDGTGTTANGYLVRADIVATDRLRVFAGYSDAPEISEGDLVDTRTVFGGLAFDLTETMTLNLSYAHEERASFDRDTVGANVAMRF